MYGPGIDEIEDVRSAVHQDDPQDDRSERGARSAHLNRGASNVTVLVATDPLYESTDPLHQPGSTTVHHRTPSPKQGIVSDLTQIPVMCASVGSVYITYIVTIYCM